MPLQLESEVKIMNIIAAYEKAKRLPKRKILIRCLELKDHWAFMFSNRAVESDASIFGACYDLVHKKTGTIELVPIIPSNLYRFEDGVDINLNIFKSKLRTKM